MTETRLWLVNNAASGSNDDKALALLEEQCGDNNLRIAYRTVFPAQELPTPAVLDAAQITLVAVFAGDGTVNALLAALRGWSGAVLVLPGGTMNLLYRRLHGDNTLDQTVAAVGRGEARHRRPGIVRNRHGDAYAGVLAGPGASWGRVREAMREVAVVDLAESALQAVQDTLGGEMIACVEPPLGRAEGYPLVNLTPHDSGIEIDGYASQTFGEYAGQVWALMKRDFRQGPHDTLGQADKVRLVSPSGAAFGLLIDGEEVECGADEVFTLVPCDVDLLATRDDAD
jgi:hypothetical protein